MQARFSESVIQDLYELLGSSFFENVQNLNQISDIVRKIMKKIFVFELIASDLVALNSHY